MNELQIFSNKAFGSMRVVEQDGQPWFVASDVARALGYERPNDAINAHCKKVNKFSYGDSQPQPYNIIPESDVYRLIMRSNLPDAERFQDWLVEEVLPTIRRHGAYLTPDTLEKVLDDPDTLIRLATNLKDERARRAALEVQAERDRPKVVFAESIEVARTSILVGEMAKLITQSTGHKIGQNRMFDWLKDNEYLHKHGSQRHMPTQYAMERGWFEIKEGTRIGSSGECHITKTSKITGKGQIYFVNLFKNMVEERAE